MSYRRLLDLADDGALARGRAYADQGRVEIRSVGPAGVVAVASGEHVYDVQLDGEGGSCTCPVGLRGDFCKHLVASVLALEDPTDVSAQQASSGPELAASTSQWLSRLNTGQLRDVVRDLARDPDVIERLDRLAAAATGDVSMLRPLVDSLRVRGHLDYERANRHGGEAHAVVDRLAEVMTPTTAPGLLPLLERAIDHLTRAILRSDDSSGIQGEALGRLLDLHPVAARDAQLDPDRLVTWMVRVGFADHGFTEIDPVDYALALGEGGLAAYRREVERQRVADPDSFAARRALERLAVLAGDVPVIVELVGGPLDRPSYFARLVDALLEVGAENEALSYAIRGLDAAPVAQQTIPLYDLAVRLLGERGEKQEALRLRKRQLLAFPTEASYGAVRRAARDTGEWDEERLSALDVLLERNPPAWVTVLLGEGETALAWEAARDMELSQPLRLKLLRTRAKTHPADVFDGYVELVEVALGPADRQAYTAGVALLGDLRRAAIGSDRVADYQTLVADLLEKHKRRPTLVAQLRRKPPA